MNRPWARAWLLACLGFAASAAAPAEPPPQPAPVGDERLYQDAMQCKVHLEALEAVATKSSDRKRFRKLLAYWAESERHAGAKLGKSVEEMIKDEMFFGFAEADRPDAHARAELCVRAGLMGMRYDRGR